MTDLEGIVDEIRRADVRYGRFRSTHEAYGVLAEEMAELLDAIRENDIDAIRQEARQVAAIAMRLYRSEGTEFLKRSGCA